MELVLQREVTGAEVFEVKEKGYLSIYHRECTSGVSYY